MIEGRRVTKIALELLIVVTNDFVDKLQALATAVEVERPDTAVYLRRLAEYNAGTATDVIWQTRL